MSTKKKNQKQHYIDQNIEAVRDTSNPIATAANQLKSTPKDFWEQFLGLGSYSASKHEGELSEGEELDLSSMQEEGTEHREIEPGIDYRREIIHGERRTLSKEQNEFEQRIAEILGELRQLISASAELQVQFKEVAIEQRIEKPGKYHITFFEWVLTVIKTARMRVEDSQSWLAMFASKKKQKSYWNQFKKHGTTFGLSNERNVSTQTG